LKFGEQPESDELSISFFGQSGGGKGRTRLPTSTQDPVPGSPVSIPLALATHPAIRENRFFWVWRVWKGLSPQFGIIAGVKDHAKGGSVENLQEREKRLSDRECAYEEAHQDLKRETEVLGAPGRFPLSENIVASNSMEGFSWFG